MHDLGRQIKPLHLMVLLFCLFAGGLVSCRSEGNIEVTPTLSPLQQELQHSAEAWQAHNIDSYTMQVTYRKGSWHPQILQIRVVSGVAEIEEHDCMPERDCGLRSVEAEDFSIDAILAAVLAQATINGVDHVVYHEDYAFPRISQTANGSYEISNFKPLAE